MYRAQASLYGHLASPCGWHDSNRAVRVIAVQVTWWFLACKADNDELSLNMTAWSER